MKIELKVLAGQEAGRVFSCNGTQTVLLGRDPSCQVVLADAHVSRQHCRLDWGPDGLRLKDTNSRNGTVANGRKLGGRQAGGQASGPLDCLLNDGDQIMVGQTRLQVKLMGGPAPQPQPPQVPSPGQDPYARFGAHGSTGNDQADTGTEPRDRYAHFDAEAPAEGGRADAETGPRDPYARFDPGPRKPNDP